MKFDAEAYYQAERASHDQSLFMQVDKDQYIDAIKRLPSFGITLGGVFVGGALMNGDRFHIAIHPNARGLVGARILEAIEWGFSLANPFTAIVARRNQDVLNLVERYEYELVDQDAETLTYKIYRGN